MAGDEFRDLQTDTHLAKWYNDILSQLMGACNGARIANGSHPHIDFLRSFHSAVDTLAANCEFLFKGVYVTNKETNTSELLFRIVNKKRETINQMMTNMYVHPEQMTRLNFMNATRECEQLHEMILDGLQRLKMLVRVSTREPRGKDTIQHWNTKSALRKGDLTHRKDKEGRVIV